MRNEFRSFAEMLEASTPLGRPSMPQDDKEAAPLEIDVEPEILADEFELARDVRVFRARIADAVDGAVETILTDIAVDVLARELRLAPADVDRIVNAALERFFGENPLRVRVHRDDVARVSCAVPVTGDESLLPGDAVIELQNGSIDASLGVRLATLLAKAAG